jgi:hypothetical protein
VVGAIVDELQRTVKVVFAYDRAVCRMLEQVTTSVVGEV